MNPVTPEWAPRDGSVTSQKNPARRASKKALRRESFIESMIFMIPDCIRLVHICFFLSFPIRAFAHFVS
jgi:hypothetical protein